jgi:REP element-mobilizing transposase RayT
MSNHVCHEIYLHITWQTKDSFPLLTPQLEPIVHEILTNRCRSTKGVYIHGINGTSNHVHLAINIEPTVTISDLVGELKGFSSHEINQQQRMKRLEWQRGFGVVSFGKRNLPWVLDYIDRQKVHQGAGKVNSRLERIGFDDDGTALDA